MEVRYILESAVPHGEGKTSSLADSHQGEVGVLHEPARERGQAVLGYPVHSLGALVGGVS